ncbi:helix-turn-helix domain-containing protein [Allofranklinella schreckenbergeri]|uniref:Helix-turn-helix domain-containing protein n=1 Tax=Allofranklinella schreckenbergeri TaxID=1076744 RepID=A0A3M6QTB6_9BURK|nr:helix-turn-helix domain-containing protein [Allofranklinella schreckenbergeri]RMX06267.1 helix-turn-helix domain-containing protein [Allofranklinella schreckenbergeri]
MHIQKLRLQRGWSQQQLAELSGLSTRTIQRLENGHSASVESLKALAAVFEVDFHSLKGETAMPAAAPFASPPTAALPHAEPDAAPHASTHAPAPSASPSLAEQEEALALRHVRRLKAFYRHAMVYALVMPSLFVIDALTSPGLWWAQWPALGWGLTLLIKGLRLSDWPMGPEWEKRQVEKRLGRKL